MASGSKIAVYSAIIGNSIIMVAKFIAYFASGSSAMLSEGIHSFADVSNQCLLALGIQRSQKRPDRKHPYGYTRERYIWALISAVGIFFLGCGVTVYHGIHSIADPTEIRQINLVYGILLLSLVVEGATLAIAVVAVSREAAFEKISFLRYIASPSDPMGIAVILEDSAAVLGVLIAAAGLVLSQWTGNLIWDGVATILIGLLLGAVAVFLTYKTRGLLVGQAMPAAKRAKVLAILREDPAVEEVFDVKTAIIGANEVRFKAEVEFDGEWIAEEYVSHLNLEDVLARIQDKESLQTFLIQYGDHIIETLGDQIDRLEDKIRQAEPSVKHVDIETD